jgi:type IV secretion system protein VirB10
MLHTKPRRLMNYSASLIIVTLICSPPLFALQNRSRNSDKPITITKQAITIAAEIVLKLRLQSRLSSATAKTGDKFKAVLFEDIEVDNLRVLPEGCLVEGRITAATPAQRGNKSGTIAIIFDRLILPSGRGVPIIGELTSLNADERRQIDEEGRLEGSSTKRTVVFIGGGAAGGAAIGAIAGGGKGAGIGAAVGAGAGVLGALLTRGQEAVLEPGTEFGLLLTEPLRIPNAGNRSNKQLRNEDIPSDTAREEKIYNDRETIYRGQVRLRELGYLRSAPSGRISPAVKRSLLRYQQDNNLRPTGLFDYPTALSLDIINEQERQSDR